MKTAGVSDIGLAGLHLGGAGGTEEAMDVRDVGTQRRLTLVRIGPEESLSLPDGATVLNSWLEAAPVLGSGSTVVALIEVPSAPPEADAAWARRWNVSADTAGPTDRSGSEGRERADTT
jgi:hypothetical protein